FDSEQIINLALKAGSGIVKGGQRGDRHTFVGRIFGRVQKPVFAVLREEIMNLENASVSATIIGDHQGQLGVEIAAQKFGQRGAVAARNPAMQFIAAHGPYVGGAALEMFEKRRLQSRKVSHRETILTI